MTHLNDPESMTWLLSTHLKQVSEFYKFGSAVITGNEDCPESIALYWEPEPLVSDIPRVFTLNPETNNYKENEA